MPLITKDLTNTENLSLLSQAFEYAKASKELLKQGKYAESIYKAMKSVKRIEELLELRREENPDIGVLAAPFYYVQANALISYVETNIDEFGNLQQLPEIEDSEEEDEDDSEGAEGNEEEN